MLGEAEGKSSTNQAIKHKYLGLIRLLFIFFRIIAVNYPARAKGVTRHMRGDEAREQCPEIELVKVPNIREKADLSKYRNAGKQVAMVLQEYTELLSRASVDEAYLDITQQVQNRLIEMNQVNWSWKIYMTNERDNRCCILLRVNSLCNRMH